MKFRKVCCLFLVFCMVFTVTVSASNDDHFRLYSDTGLRGGIGSVTCGNHIDAQQYPVLHNAVEAAIDDWDWHLGLLNAEYNVNWNLFSIGTGSHPDLMFTIDKSQQIPSDKWAVTRHYIYDTSDNVPVDPDTVNKMWVAHNPAVGPWDYGYVWFSIENIRNDGYLNDFESMRGLANHEIGHFLGLNEYWSDYGVVMFPGANRTSNVPTRADLMGIYELYT